MHSSVPRPAAGPAPGPQVPCAAAKPGFPRGKVLHFSDLERAIPGISQKTLIQQLRRMESDGIIHHQVPPRVEYGLAGCGQALCQALDALLKWTALRGAEPADR
jgi:DNA-binding HxlR family transcriptional regulator